MRLAAAILIVLVHQSALTQDFPPLTSADDYIDANEEFERLGPMDGVWIGMLKPIHDPVGAYREWPDGFLIQIEIRGDDIGLWFIEEGNVLEAFPGDSVLMFAVDGTALIDYVAGSEIFNEIWSFSLNHVEPDLMKGFVSRTVHNFAIRRDSPWRIFPVYSVIDLERQ